MTTDPPMNDADQTLSAFADGELDGEQNLQMLKRMAKDPSIAKRVAQEHKLRQAVATAMDDPQLNAPAQLRDRVRQLAQTEQGEQTRHVTQPTPASPHTDSPVLAVIGRWLPAAVAAVLFIGSLVVLNQNGADSDNRLITATQVLNASLVDQFGNRHVKCARDFSPMVGTDQFPQNLSALPGALSEYFQQPIEQDVLNLSSLGYEFDMAGLCILPGKGSVHIIYKSKASTGQTDTLSLWLRPIDEASQIQPDKLYTVENLQDNFPMLVWRHGEMAYYLVGDSQDAVQRAFDVIGQNQG